MKTKALILLLVVTLLTLSGCKKEGESVGTTTAAATTESQGILTMGTNAEFPPFEFVADNNAGIVDEFDGVDIAIAKAVAEKMGYTLKIENMAFETLIMSLQNGKVDFVAAGMTVDEERSKNVDFSERYYKAVQYILVAADSEIASAEDLTGKSVGVQNGTTGDFIATDDIDCEVSRYNRGIDAVLDLKNGKIDAVIIDSMPAENFYSKNADVLKIVQDDEFFGDEEYAIAVKKGNTELLEKINETIKELKESGEIEKLVDKYSN